MTAVSEPWAASSNTASLSMVSACSGVFGDLAPRRQASPLGASKVLDHRVRGGPLGERVQPAAVAVLALARPSSRARRRSPRWSRRPAAAGRRSGPPIFAESSPRGLQGGVADQLGLEPHARAAGQQHVLRVLREQVPGVTRDDCRYVALVTISLCSLLDRPAVAR